MLSMYTMESVSGDIKIGIGLPTRAPGLRGDVLLEWATRADRGPFASLAVTDRVAFEAQEPLIALAVAAGATRRVRLLTSILLAPTRETTLLARQAASLDALSDGRLTLGVAIGAREADYNATGYAFHERGRRLDEQLPLLRRIWAGELVVAGVGPIGPAPFRAGGPELLIGGYVPAVARRVAAWGDGFMAPGGGEPAAMLELWRAIEAAWAAAGRAGRPRWVSGSYYALGPTAEADASAYIEATYGSDPALAERRLRGLPRTRSAVVEAIQRAADSGVDELVLRPCSARIDQLDRLAELVDRA
jgi:alkanesulfonate monooxygenase SsuD/methylene tetrahydromethanopterin reductase-like flavin-dependent oxidoreductase (luciferase family)